MPVLEVSTMNPLCGENYFVNTSGTILSPGYRQGQYPVDLRCVYVINITGSPMLFHIWFDEFHHSSNPAQNCIGSDQVRIHTPENNQTYGPYCSTENTNPDVIEVERHVAIVELETDSVLNNGSFRLKYSVSAPPTTSNSPDYTAELPDDKGDPPPIQQVSEDDRWPTWMIILIAVAGTCLVAMVLIILAVIRKKQLAAAALSGMVSRNSEGSGKDEWWLNRLYNNVIPDDEGIHSEYEEDEPIYDNQIFNRP
ncbi:uncharacterized protein LOC106170417 [Lingula anatina]|uniref:Uncharacterized protein LOC106170417 n=1 Tax=Lingula anatina TaxID=7574 RepID=A0A1S3J645_LINAN|nr:uncharacterized protein LOC106170417 [Lingula anatina]|eukprot:XP_013405721.1 uncharacterized protein LOC106170417 [Lingula anatina]